jgi:membrane-bound acyltransferase YfiQ involved in biofilm formation
MSIISGFNPQTQSFLTFLGKFSGLLNVIAVSIAAMWLIHITIRKPNPADTDRIRTIKKYSFIVLCLAALMLVAMTNVGMMLVSNRELSGVLGIFALAKAIGL